MGQTRWTAQEVSGRVPSAGDRRAGDRPGGRTRHATWGSRLTVSLTGLLPRLERLQLTRPAGWIVASSI